MNKKDYDILKQLIKVSIAESMEPPSTMQEPSNSPEDLQSTLESISSEIQSAQTISDLRRILVQKTIPIRDKPEELQQLRKMQLAMQKIETEAKDITRAGGLLDKFLELIRKTQNP